MSETSPDFRQHLHDRMSGDISQEWTQGRRDRCQPPACLKLVVLARARARELQVDQQVERDNNLCQPRLLIPTTKPKPKTAAEADKPICRFFLKPDGCKNGDNCQYAHPRTNGKCLRSGSESHNLQACTRPRRQQSSRSSSAKPGPKKTYAKPKGKTADAQAFSQ